MEQGVLLESADCAAALLQISSLFLAYSAVGRKGGGKAGERERERDGVALGSQGGWERSRRDTICMTKTKGFLHLEIGKEKFGKTVFFLQSARSLIVSFFHIFVLCL